jgi:hypothetical protein
MPEAAVTTLNTPFGKPACSASQASTEALDKYVAEKVKEEMK